MVLHHWWIYVIVLDEAIVEMAIGNTIMPVFHIHLKAQGRSSMADHYMKIWNLFSLCIENESCGEALQILMTERNVNKIKEMWIRFS